MESQMYQNPATILKFSPKTVTTVSFSFYPIQPKRRIHAIALSSSNQNPQELVTTSTTTIPTQPAKSGPYSVEFKTLSACRLGISRYPNFEYNAKGGTGTGNGIKNDSSPDEISVSFDLQTLYIPPLTSETTRFLGLPLPPFLKIDIVPELFHGAINEETGKVDLEFKAKFLFSAGRIYKAPPLMVRTILTSEESSGTMKRGRGERLDGKGKCRLVGVAVVDPVNDVFMNSFLGLPTECLAELNAFISISAS
ncbi:uncharacterized protein LOC122664943 [Telopea speciosissima]|uniref:uncharacterized protein LOC122664943 n=1 Tax=Telopea speciosissima TaxID=54955 RepID=UPI001CC719A6|nr:uncharacterized protein LOC122664943 [Telopea speciosissima]